MIQASISVLQYSSFFNDFYHKNAQLLFNNKNLQKNIDIAQLLKSQEPIVTASIAVNGHAMQAFTHYNSDDKHELLVACASVSTLCKVLSAVLGHNIEALVFLKAYNEGTFECKVNYQKMIDTVSLHNIHHYVEVFGAMKSFVIGMQFVAQNYPSALQCIIDMV